MSKSSDSYRKPKVAIFTTAVYKLFTTFYTFMNSAADKSSTHLLTDVFEEWEQVFAKDVNLILLKCFMQFASKTSKYIMNGNQSIFIASFNHHMVTFNYR